jgi:hypothetical protein
MSAITSSHHNAYVPAQEIYAKILRDLRSFMPSNSIDEGEFPVWTKEVLDNLGTGVMKEEEALLRVCDRKTKLPDDFHDFYAAYKCHHRGTDKDIIYQQNTFTAFQDVELNIFNKEKGCEIDCCSAKNQLVETIKVRQYVGTGCLTHEFHRPMLLHLAAHSLLDHFEENNAEHRGLNTDDTEWNDEFAIGVHRRNHREISISDGFIYTHFKRDFIYLQYYALPLDQEGMPMLPDNTQIKKAVEWWIKYQLMLNWWFNSEVPDMQSRWQKAEIEYQRWFSEAEYIVKLPSFQQMLNSTRNARTYNKVSYFSNSDWKRTGW